MSAEQVEAVKSGYVFSTPALELGALVVEGGAADPSAPIRVPLAMLNGHGLVAGATGTGKTKTLQVMAEQLSAAGVPVFLADIKGDVSGMAVAGETNDKITSRMQEIGQEWTPTAGVLLRELIAFSDAGAEDFFGEPEFASSDLLRSTPDGRGVVSILELPGVVQQPALFSSFLMWLLTDLFQDLPEVGDPDKPKLCFVFDEAHLLFKDASKQFLESITQTVRLIRSKGVGVFFVTQTPKDVHPDVLAQLGNRVQHALRAYTPDDAKTLKATASTFPKSGYDLEEVLEETTKNSVLYSKYATAVDRESAHEMLASRLNPQAGTPEQGGYPQGDPQAGTRPQLPPPSAPKPAKAAKQEPGMVEQVLGSRTTQNLIKSAAAAAGAAIVRDLRHRPALEEVVLIA